MSANTDPATAGWAVLPDNEGAGSYREPSPTAPPRDRWSGVVRPITSGWSWAITFDGPYAQGAVEGFSKSRAGAIGAATRFARAALRAL